MRPSFKEKYYTETLYDIFFWFKLTYKAILTDAHTQRGQQSSFRSNTIHNASKMLLKLSKHQSSRYSAAICKGLLQTDFIKYINNNYYLNTDTTCSNFPLRFWTFIFEF